MALYGLPMRPISGKLDPREVGDRNGEPQGLCARQRFHGFGPEHCCGRGRNPTPRAGRAGRGKSAKQRQGRTDGEHVYLYTPIHSRLVARPLRWRRRGHQLIKGGVIAQCVAAQRIILGHAAGLDFAPCHISQPAPVQRAIDKTFRAQEHPYLALPVLGEGFKIAVRLLEMHRHKIADEIEYPHEAEPAFLIGDRFVQLQHFVADRRKRCGTALSIGVTTRK